MWGHCWRLWLVGFQQRLGFCSSTAAELQGSSHQNRSLNMHESGIQEGTAVLVTNMRNFPASRGAVAGILKGYSGISGTIFTKIYSTVLKNSSHFLLFLAIGIPALCFSIMFLIRPCTPASGDDSAEHGHFAFIQFSSVVLGLYLIATTAFSNVLPLSGKSSSVLFVVMILLIMDPLVIPVKMTLLPTKCSKPETSNLQVGSSSECLVQQGKEEKTEHLLPSSSSSATHGNFYDADKSSEVAMLLAEGEGAVKKKRRPK
ncbi:hypothetical protein K1719_003271 [Acacia pycnantha]|nr:hypothetical protein K1719_003271 [Acacia pycnantha]